MRRELKMAVALPALVIGVAACGGGSGGGHASSSGGGAYSQPAATPKAATGLTVKVATTKLGRILTDSNGRTLYLFKKDTGANSACSGACASIWPPVSATGVAGPGLSAAKLGSIKRSDGKTEATYAGHPLYTYAGDSKPGETSGQGLDQFGAEWYVLAPSGRQIGD